MLHDIIDVIHPSIFRAYDIRGVVGKTLTENGVFLIGKALGSLVQERGETSMTVARDGRLSSPALAASLSAGILATGCDVIDIGMVPTPLLYYATCLFESHSGVMVTGSHNPSDYNGLKMVVGGKTLAEQDIQDLQQRITERRFSAGHGTCYPMLVASRYITQVQQNVQLQRPLKIVVDAGHGVTGVIAPELYEKMGCEVYQLYCDIDGTFPHHHADPSEEKNLQDLIHAVQQQQADIGLAFDGDGDRLGVVTPQGKIIWPDRLLMLFAQSVLAKHPAAKIIYDVKCTDHLDTLIRSLGGEPIMWRTGHSMIKAKLAETKAALAGEMSGHFFFQDHWYGFDDALYAGARLLEILSQQPHDIDTVFAAIPNSVNTPELRVPVSDEEKFKLLETLAADTRFVAGKEISTIDGLRVKFTDGWGLVRPSNTSPYLILRFEALNETILAEIKAHFRAWLLAAEPNLVLPF
jgi:phosphomannomutase/phosphoglucomutase